MKNGTVAFLLLGETLLVPHILPIAVALARLRPGLRIDLWVGGPEVEALVVASGALQAGSLRLRRAPGYGGGASRWWKLAMLARLAPRLIGARVAVCAERTSLWLPTLLPLGTRFIKTHHGAGSVQVRTGPRRRAAWATLVPGETERAACLAAGHSDHAVFAIGYIKASFPRVAPRAVGFADDRPVLLYAPHWQRHRSSWWRWGEAIVTMLAAQRSHNVILAPHQRLAETAPEMPAMLARVAALPHVEVVLGGPSLIDGSLLDAATIYLGDTSSQVVEFLARPRPCVFLNPDRLAWAAREDRRFWSCGEVVESLDRLWEMVERAGDRHARFVDVQRAVAAEALGDVSPEAPATAARIVLAAMTDRRR